jgi:hypothetical protein
MKQYQTFRVLPLSQYLRSDRSHFWKTVELTLHHLYLKTSTELTMDIRLPFKKTRLVTAHKVHGIATKIGHTTLANALEVGIERIEKELVPKECKKCAKLKNTEKQTGLQDTHSAASGHDQHSLTSNHHKQNNNEDGGFAYERDNKVEGSTPWQHPPILKHIDRPNLESRWLQKESRTGSSKEFPIEKTQRFVPEPQGHGPKISFRKGIRKGLIDYVRHIVAHELEQEVDKRVQERLGSITEAQGQNRGRSRGESHGRDSGKTRKNSIQSRDPQVALQQLQGRSDAATESQQNWWEVRAREHSQDDKIRQKRRTRNASELQKGKHRTQPTRDKFPEQFASGANGPGPTPPSQRQDPVPTPDPANFSPTVTAATSQSTSPLLPSDDEEAPLRKAPTLRPETPLNEGNEHRFERDLAYEGASGTTESVVKEPVTAAPLVRSEIPPVSPPIEEGGWAFPSDLNAASSSPRSGSLAPLGSSGTTQHPFSRHAEDNRREGDRQLQIKADRIYRVDTSEAMARWGDPVKAAQERAARKKYR